MRIVELSNHPRALLREAAEQRRAQQAVLEARHQSALEAHRAEIARLDGERAPARAERRWWTWWKLRSALRRAKRDMPRPPSPAPGPSDREHALAAGMEGESLVERYLAPVLDDRWTLLRGYRNRRGEIDHILLGPTRAIAIEVKHRNATVHCDGDEWWFEKFDRYGNLVEHGSLADRGGRSPSQQLRQPLDELLKFLASRDAAIEIVPVVYFSHERSQLGSYANLTVDVCTAPDHILTIARRESPVAELSPQRLARVEELIVRDHRFHEASRSRR
jgi:hypothetical protein